MEYKMNHVPLKYGIMYTEDMTRRAETVWYETEESRDEAELHIRTTGYLEINSNDSILGRVVKVQAYTIIKADDFYYRRSE